MVKIPTNNFLSYLLISPVIIGLIVGTGFLSIDPFGHTSFKIMGKQPKIRTITLIGICIMILMLYFFFYPHLPLSPRLASSFIIPAFGLFAHELLWHYGCWKVWGTGIPTFWAFYCGAIFICILALHSRYNILNVTPIRIVLLCVISSNQVLAWNKFIIQAGFYQHLLKFEKGLTSDPHGTTIFTIGMVGWYMWLLIARKGEKKHEDPRL